MLRKLRIIMTFLTIASLSLAAMPLISNVSASSGRDCDTNAVIRCGVLSKTELRNSINNGGSGPNQSPTELKALFSKFGLSNLNDIDRMKDGTVTKSGQVIVDGRIVASNVKSIGRHNLPGSTQVPGIPYPLFMRSPSVSFLSNSLSAFVLMNDDGSMALAVIKSCGNIVPGTVTHILTIKKWEDKNGNQKIDEGEPFLSGWSFKLSGTINKVVTTGVDGTVAVSVPASVFNVDEILQPGWVSTTGTHAIAHMTGGDGKIFFGNKKIEEKKFEIKAVKFEDKDKDKVQDGDEVRLPDWRFKLVGNGIERELTTNNDGEALFADLPAGTYTLTETLKEGWENVTPITQTVTIPKDSDQKQFCVFFANVKKEVEKKVNLKIIKFEDKNGDKIIQGDEPLLSGWEFKVTGPDNFEKNVVTGANGIIELTNLKPGSYTVKETLQENWENTTPLIQTLNIQSDTGVFQFGNKKKEVKVNKINIKIIKFEDKNEDKLLEGDEPLLSGWEFKITGPDRFEKTVFTGANGIVELTGLEPGNYSVTEKLQDGWENTTSLTQALDIKSDTGVFQFGNRKKEVPIPVTPSSVPTTVSQEVPSLPVTGPAEAVMGSIGTVSLMGAFGYLRKSKKLFKKNQRKIK